MIYYIKRNTIFFKIRDPSWTPQKIEQFLTHTLAISKGDVAKDGENSQKVVKSMRIMYIYIYVICFSGDPCWWKLLNLPIISSNQTCTSERCLTNDAYGSSRLRALRALRAELPGVSGDEESKGKGEAKQRHSRGSERNETLTPHPDVKTLGDFLFILGKISFFLEYVFFQQNFQRSELYEQLLLILGELYMIGVSLVLVSCCIFRINTCDHPMRFPWSRGRILTPKKTVYFRESGQIVITRVHGLHSLFQRFP